MVRPFSAPDLWDFRSQTSFWTVSCHYVTMTPRVIVLVLFVFAVWANAQTFRCRLLPGNVWILLSANTIVPRICWINAYVKWMWTQVVQIHLNWTEEWSKRGENSQNYCDTLEKNYIQVSKVGILLYLVKLWLKQVSYCGWAFQINFFHPFCVVMDFGDIYFSETSLPSH